MNKNSRVNTVYIAGMIPVVFLIGLLLFLTFDNFLSGRAIYGDKLGNAYEVEGFAALLVNLGILGLLVWLVSYLAFLANRSPALLRLHRCIGVASGLCIAAGLVLGFPLHGH